MTARGSKIDEGGWEVQNVLKCGRPLPLSDDLEYPCCPCSTRGLGQSKTWRTIVVSCLFMAVLCHSAPAQYSVDWFTIDGGGGGSTGGIYSVAGTIGQPDAGALTGGQFTLTGGFWGIIAAVQTPGAPLLSVTRTATNTVVVSWPTPADGWVLEHTNALPSLPVVSWPQVPPPYQTNAGSISMTFTNTPPVGNRFFRLQQHGN